MSTALKFETKFIETPIGKMIAAADDFSLLFLAFADNTNLNESTENKDNNNHILDRASVELEGYFEGKLQKFTLPINISGSPFQKNAWSELLKIPYGETRSYKSQASVMGKPAAYRAVANANGKNQIAIIIPCHRIIQSNGNLGGYNGGISRKQWLLDHEKRHYSGY